MTTTITGAGTSPAGSGPAGEASVTSDALEYGTFAWGAVTYPLATGSGNSTLRDVDPTVYHLLAYLATMLDTYAGSAWSERCTAAAGPFAAVASTIVAARVGYDPARYLTERQTKLPLLAVYRRKGRAADHTLTWERSDTTIGIDWVLPPMSAGEAEQMAPMLWAALPIFEKKLVDLQDDAYLSGQRVYDVTAIQECGVVDFTIGDWSVSDKLAFPTLSMTALVKERRNLPADAFEAITAVSVSLDLHDPTDDTTKPDVVQVDAIR